MWSLLPSGRRCRAIARSAIGPLLGLVLGLSVVARGLSAQVTVIDEGTFTLSVAGERIGREDFSIRTTRSGGVVSFVAQGTVLTGERRLIVALNLDSIGAPTRLQSETRDGATIIESYAGRLERGIWSGRASRADGESARELLFPAGALATDDRLVHHLWLVMRFGGQGVLTLIAPRTLAQRTVRVEEVGAERLTLGLRELAVRRWVVREIAGGTILWEVWTDSAGRVLRALDPSRGLEAIRDEPPS